MDIEEIIALSVKHNASDLHLCSMQRPRWRHQGRLTERDGLPVLSMQQLESFAGRWLNAAQVSQLEQHGQVDLAIHLHGVRLRANFFRQQTGVSLALRRIASELPTLQQLQAPDILTALTACQQGLILVTGATGSGKSTTLAAMINLLNRQQQKHILTLEDPIEFIHHSAHSLIQQREIGTHCRSFAAGLRAALREDPDVILLGELRDEQTIRLALTAAETGHLVLATLHARGAVAALERLTDVFSAAEKVPVRAQLAASLQAVIAQHLIPAAGAGRVALFEVLITTPAIASLMREGKNHQIASQLQTGKAWGMQTFAQSLSQRQQAGLIDGQEWELNQSCRIMTAD
ncbi:type IV pili twitching motility protein PilT [Erwinia sp. OLTSP20]|uniref:type IV pilus twitching motility protein PilT n=1 Tax=unclassified Erwinia TaxID=2622719 RepID=UPI000C17E755|nr:MULTISPECIES: PilT/PilU family type 4a pilus ATPase [unclassified Erwinia]PIJ48903.1 type IV pili twitching motility protein PilT [Erwinia sp. OAMSP11]PIJ74556.1 type IV pili twitching motility protein PilT [Erwinia sp. OLSSP12]PIJ79587.1 type IV pili twitching motility protein PilT [Erwinia sp. OLCASP19]PIJ80372.1 type IV pili twitching motility protein PilT [Erwinia sp. OLMTSP26]PIJ82487.1 type IV pili twitching motility protein PilT [Erwinia sp. OLMDSP33]